MNIFYYFYALLNNTLRAKIYLLIIDQNILDQEICVFGFC
jgi:hypothetical protein